MINPLSPLNTNSNASKIPSNLTDSVQRVEKIDLKTEQQPKQLDISNKDLHNKSHDEPNLQNEKERQKIQESMNSLLNGMNTGLSLRFHEKSGVWYGVVENKITNEVVKEVPPKYILDLHAKLKEMVGVFLDKKV